MKTLTSMKGKGSQKSERQMKVLFGLIEHFVKTGRPVGSQALQEAGFEDLSSATIRNYFSHLEEEGFLAQQHTSGGRIPTHLGFRVYAEEFLKKGVISQQEEAQFKQLADVETKEVVVQMQKIAEELSKLTSTAIIVTSPRFDQDTILDVKVVPIDSHRLLVVLITDFGSLHTETLHSEKPIHSFGAKRIEGYFRSRLLNMLKPENLELDEEKLAQKFYSEVMIRYMISYSNFIEEELFKTGFSKLLNFPELHDASKLATTLSLFENHHSLRLLLKDTMKHDGLKVWIGDDLSNYLTSHEEISFMGIPYRINGRKAGVIALLGPTRLGYPRIFGLMQSAAEAMSQMLTKNIYKFKISVREPSERTLLLDGPQVKLLENKKK